MSDNRKKEGQTGLFLVALYDILDQSDLMDQWDDPVEVHKEETDAKVAHKATFESVLSVRADFQGLLDGFSRIVKLPDDLQKEISDNPSLFDLVNQKIPYQIRSQSFSDTTIWYTATNDVSGSYLCRELALLISGVAMTHLFALSRGIPGRCGIGLGCASDYLGLFSKPQRDEIYGPGLLRAYKLESKTAQYPRVVVDDRLIELLDVHSNDLATIKRGSPEYAMAQYENIYSQIIRDYIFIDDDGVLSLDFAGEKAASSFIPTFTSVGEKPSKIFGDAFEFAQKEYTKFIDERNSKLASRYHRLAAYLHSRKQFWE